MVPDPPRLTGIFAGNTEFLSPTFFGIDFSEERTVELLEGLSFELRRVVRCWSRHPDTSFPGTHRPHFRVSSYRGKPSI